MEDYEAGGLALTNQDADDELEYARSRRENLNQRQVTTKKFSLGALKERSAKTLSKFDRYMEEIRQGKFLTTSSRKTAATGSQETDVDHMTAVDETKELFSDSEGEGEGEEVLNGEAAVMEEYDGDSDTRPNSPSPPPPPPSSTILESSGSKRPNPFKVQETGVSLLL